MPGGWRSHRQHSSGVIALDGSIAWKASIVRRPFSSTLSISSLALVAQCSSSSCASRVDKVDLPSVVHLGAYPVAAPLIATLPLRLVAHPDLTGHRLENTSTDGVR